MRWACGTLPTDRTFTGQRSELVSAVGSLMDYGARFYSPLLGRFISADSIVPQPGNPQSLNRYSYVNNRPLNLVDPSGHTAQTFIAPPCGICDREWADISSWSEAAKSLAVVACFIIGCNVDYESNVIYGPTSHEYYQSAVASAYGMGSVETVAIKAVSLASDDIASKITTRALGDAARKFVSSAAKEADEKVMREGLQGTFQIVAEAARKGEEILPGLFKYGSDSIDGYAQHHLWPEAMGGPRQGWIIFAKHPHNTLEGIQGRLNKYLTNSLGIGIREIEALGRKDPAKILPHLREFYKTEGITFPY